MTEARCSSIIFPPPVISIPEEDEYPSSLGFPSSSSTTEYSISDCESQDNGLVGRSISCSPWSISPSRSPTFRHHRSETAARIRTQKKFSKSFKKAKEEPNLSPYEHLSKITFLIKRSTFGRTGWKVMPEDIDIDMNRLPDSLLANIMGILREAELSGKAVPEKITLNL
ncbi:uncharacterized protein [Lepeophtheirus salmonis]|uniref:Uncharacterized protein n=1 Tax=Lepeophtheirus salmonis TaxID=72036 RepID=A0A0K2UEV4_LEPSM|nr:uncharacterized protein LOC121123442 isoform X1 [Lepeophtheirus salmonis]